MAICPHTYPESAACLTTLAESAIALALLSVLLTLLLLLVLLPISMTTPCYDDN